MDANALHEELSGLLTGISDELLEAAELAGKLVACFEDGDGDKTRAQRWQMSLLQNPINDILEQMENADGSVMLEEETPLLLSLSKPRLKALTDAADAAIDIIPNEIIRRGSTVADTREAVAEAKESLPK